MEVTQEGQAWYVYECCRYIWHCSHTRVTTTRLYTAVSRKVALQMRRSVRDNVESDYG